MDALHLPEDLVAFLAAGKQLEYDRSECEAGMVTLVPLSELKLERFPVETSGMDVFKQDPNYPRVNSYLVLGVNLTADSDGDYDAVGLLLWLPVEGRYATWDSSHCTISVFGPEVTWTKIAADPVPHINAQWTEIDPRSPPTTDLIPWHDHPYGDAQVHQPQPA